MLVVGGQIVNVDSSQKPHSGTSQGKLFQRRRMLAIPRDQQIGVRIFPENGNDVVQTFEALQPADEQEIGIWMRTTRRRR